MPRRILLVEDHLHIRKNVAFFLRTEGYEVNEASNGKEAVQLLERDEVDLVLSDVVMPGLGGFHLLRHIRSVAPEVPVVLMSGFSLNAQQILKEGATDFIMKPFDLNELLSKLKLALGQ
jgi:two-component system OmpR family response regulator